MRTVWADLRKELADFTTLVPQEDEDAKETELELELRPPSSILPKDPAETSAPFHHPKGVPKASTPPRRGDTDAHLRALSRAAVVFVEEFDRIDRRDAGRVQALDKAKAELLAVVLTVEENVAKLQPQLEALQPELGQLHAQLDELHSDLHGRPEAQPPIPSVFERVEGLEEDKVLRGRMALAALALGALALGLTVALWGAVIVSAVLR